MVFNSIFNENKKIKTTTIIITTTKIIKTIIMIRTLVNLRNRFFFTTFTDQIKNWSFLKLIIFSLGNLGYSKSKYF